MCGYFGCHVLDCLLTQDCDCTKCSAYGANNCDNCEKFMGKARRSGWFARAASDKCKACKDAVNSKREKEK
jgi:hypothetical protein